MQRYEALVPDSRQGILLEDAPLVIGRGFPFADPATLLIKPPLCETAPAGHGCRRSRHAAVREWRFAAWREFVGNELT